VVGISEVDTRALTRHLRTHGAQRGVISTLTGDREGLRDKARASRSMVGLDLAQEVTCAESYRLPALAAPASGEPYRVVAYDYGMKQNIVRMLRNAGCDVTVVPARTSAAEALKLGPHGVFLSNGPGDPEPVDYAVEASREFMERRVPVFGICLGHQILGLACGAKTFKLKFGHRGANQPVIETSTGRVDITSQNHGFAVDLKSLPDDVETTHINLNDKTSEGQRHKKLPCFSVQYHPEAAPGPNDAFHLFDRFVKMVDAKG
jgi:carbamoyl-phosphate synthase small subunit